MNEMFAAPCCWIAIDRKKNTLSLKYKIQSLDWVHSVVTLLDIPLLDNSDTSLQDRLDNFITLKDEGVDKEKGFNEILNSPVFRNFVISEDGSTSGIIVYIKENEINRQIQTRNKHELENYKDDCYDPWYQFLSIHIYYFSLFLHWLQTLSSIVVFFWELT